MVDKRTLNRRADYDSKDFADRWASSETVESIALDLNVSMQAVRKAAIRRGLGTKTEARTRTCESRC